MFSVAILIAAGPLLTTAMAMVALLIVHRSLSKVPHALIWSAAFGVTALRWMVTAVRSSDGGGLVPRGGLLYTLIGTVAIVLLAEGFRVRASPGTKSWVVPLVGAPVLLAEIVFYAFPATALRAAVMPAVSGGLLLWAARLTLPAGRSSSATERVVAAMLLLVAGIELSAMTLALAEQFGFVGTRAAYITLYAVTIEPVGAMLGMLTLLLIAFDFSQDQYRLIHTDPLTGVLNRLGFERAVRAMMARRRLRPLVVALVDIDRFKQINDRYGHAAGDETLVGFARHLAAGLERDEAVARIGGEEFALLLQGVDGPAALRRIDPLRDALADVAIEEVPGLRLTASFGVAQHHPGEPLESLIERADVALYRSKREGRNRSTLAVVELG
jgi:diguanylate cyclase (GGDEF)-like protein